MVIDFVNLLNIFVCFMKSKFCNNYKKAKNDFDRIITKWWNYYVKSFNSKKGKAKAIRFSILESICKLLECQPVDILIHIK